MTMLAPVLGAQVNLDITDMGTGPVDLHDGTGEVGSGLAIPEAGVKNGEGLTVQGSQGLAAHALVEPDALEQALFRQSVSLGLVTGRRLDLLGPPTGV